MQVEHAILIHASAAAVYGRYEDVASWHTWDPDTKRASLDGPVAVGTRGSLTPTKGNTVTMTITRLERDRHFTVEARIPGFRMVFEHEITPEGASVRVTHRVTFSGLLSFLIGRMLVRQLNQGLPVTLANLKRVVEQEAAKEMRA
jgi:hypothetical protein